MTTFLSGFYWFSLGGLATFIVLAVGKLVGRWHSKDWRRP